MTPLGIHLRQWRHRRRITQKQMAKAIGVSPAYLSALERGNKGTASFDLLQRIITYLNIIWDDAEKLQEIASLSNPKITINTQNLSPTATQFANRLAQVIKNLDDKTLQKLLETIEKKS